MTDIPKFITRDQIREMLKQLGLDRPIYKLRVNGTHVKVLAAVLDAQGNMLLTSAPAYVKEWHHIPIAEPVAGTTNLADAGRLAVADAAEVSASALTAFGLKGSGGDAS